MESNLGLHLVKPDGGGVYETAAVSNPSETFVQVRGWLGVDKDIIFLVGMHTR